MKKLFFLSAILVWSLSSCTKGGALIDDSLTTTLDARSSSGTNISLSLVPQSAKDLVASKYPGFSIKEAQTELEHGAKQFKLTIVQGKKTKKRLLFDSNWVFIGEKN